MKVLMPQGIGDSVWGLHKVQAVRDALDPGGAIDIALPGTPASAVESRAVDFVRRFDFVRSVEMRPWDIHRQPHIAPDGTYNYLDDGWYEFDDGAGGTERVCALMPNAALEHGTRLEDWLPQYDIDWAIFDHFHIEPWEWSLAANLRDRIGPYAVFYPGPLHGNSGDGHNRGMLWRPADWAALGSRVYRDFGLRIAVVGAPYDYDYYRWLVRPALNGDRDSWTELIGQTTVGELYAVTSTAKFVISYQSGVGIVSTYLGTPTAIWWRQQGDSISATQYLTFDERMASAWVPPARLAAGIHLPLYYGRETVDDIVSEIGRRGWA